MHKQGFTVFGTNNTTNRSEGDPVKRIVFLQTHIPDPRINKRIAVAKRLGEVSVICVRRATQDTWEPVHADVMHFIFPLDLPTSKQIVRRFFVSRSFNRPAYKKIAEINPDILYTDGLDSLMLACRYRRRHPCRIFFEVADLRECFIEKPRSVAGKIKKMLLSRIERACFRRVDRLILTSMKFFDLHYSRLTDKSRVLYMPNVPDTAVFASYKRKASGGFTVGFIGGIRYLTQMKLLVDAAGIAGCRVLFAGAGGTSEDYRGITGYCAGKDHVTFTGKYCYNEQIASLYGRVDCVYAVYDASNPNVRIALPNKLYESVYCGLPIIVARGTYLSELVGQYGVGTAVDCTDVRGLADALLRLKNDPGERAVIAESCRACAAELCDYDGINESLRKAMEESLNDR